MSNKYYVYIYLNPLKNNEPFYIGKGKGNRYKKHLCKNEHFYNNYKINTINKIIEKTNNYPPIEIYKDNLSEEDAFYLEEELIAFYGRKNNNTGILTNMTDGGEGNSGRLISEEEKKNISVRMSKPHTEQHKINQGIVKKNKIVVKDKEGKKFSVDKNDPRWISGELVGVSKGYKISDETKQLMTQKRLGRKWYNNGEEEIFTYDPPEDYITGRLPSLMNKINKNRIGIPKSDEFKEKHRINYYKRNIDQKGRLISNIIFY